MLRKIDRLISDHFCRWSTFYSLTKLSHKFISVELIEMWLCSRHSSMARSLFRTPTCKLWYVSINKPLLCVYFHNLYSSSLMLTIWCHEIFAICCRLHRVIGMAKFITETSIEEVRLHVSHQYYGLPTALLWIHFTLLLQLQKTGMKPEAQAISGGGRGIQMVVSTMGAQGAVLVRRRCPRPRSAVLLTSVSPTLSAVESDTSSLPPTAVFPSAVNDILASVDLDLLQRAPLMLQTFELHISNGRHHPSDSKPYVQESEKSSRQSSASPAQSPADAAEVFEVIR